MSKIKYFIALAISFSLMYVALVVATPERADTPVSAAVPQYYETNVCNGYDTPFGFNYQTNTGAWGQVWPGQCTTPLGTAGEVTWIYNGPTSCINIYRSASGRWVFWKTIRGQATVYLPYWGDFPSTYLVMGAMGVNSCG